MNELDYLEFRKPKPLHGRFYYVVQVLARLGVYLLIAAFCLAFWFIIYLAVASFANSASAAPIKAPHSVSSHWTRGPCLPAATNCPVATVPDWAKQ